MKVAILTTEQKDQLVGQEFTSGLCYFNPVQDGNNNWIISEQEVNFTTNQRFLWVKDLELSELVLPVQYLPKALHTQDYYKQFGVN